MRAFSIEMTASIRANRCRTYQAATLETACELAMSDMDWSGADIAGEPNPVGSITAVRADGCQLIVPETFAEPGFANGNAFEVAIGLLKIFATDSRAGRQTASHWLDRAFLAIELAEANAENESGIIQSPRQTCPENGCD
ncbi:hypothetical protein [Devosia sp. Naph2]|uniref:hypothetical protein n=1 Tax=Devosia polycyclovorans TaxID=3345148 RepID=UPI0035D089D8